MSISDDFHALNAEQEAASSWRTGPFLLLAGPGTGKTRTLVTRHRLLRLSGESCESILCLTFARAAALEMRQRIALDAGVAIEKIAAGTLHALALSLLRRFPDQFQSLVNYRLASPDQARICLQQSAIDIGWGAAVDAAGEAILRLKDRRATPADRDAAEMLAPTGMDASRLRRLFASYQATLHRAGLIDFADLINGVADGLENDWRFCETLSNGKPWVMVDEYQDLSPAQHAVIDRLIGKDRNLWAVGDDDQVLYSWRSAEVEAILNFQDRYPGAELGYLTQNYRSLPGIVSAAGRLISRNKVRFVKDLVSVRLSSSQADGTATSNPDRSGTLSSTTPASGPAIEMTTGSPDPSNFELHGAEQDKSLQGNLTPELEFISRADAEDEARGVVEMIRQAQAAGTPIEQIAVIARVGHRLGRIERALCLSGFSVDVVGAVPFIERPEIRLVLRALQDRTGVRLVEAPQAPDWISRQFAAFPGDEIARAISLCSWLSRKAPRGTSDERREAWAFSLMDLADELRQASTVKNLKRRLRGHAAGDRPSVCLSTVHGAKGREWDVVYLVGWEDGVIPHPLSKNQEEERRAAYVGLTRARNKAVVSWAEMRAGRRAGPSAFVYEMGWRTPTSRTDGHTDNPNLEPPTGTRSQTAGAIRVRAGLPGVRRRPQRRP